MIIFERETKTLVIPEGLGEGSTAGAYNEGVEAGKAAQKAIDDAKITPSTTITENGEYEAEYGFKKVVVDVNSECNIQESKILNVSTGYEQVYPDTGYDGLSVVAVDAQDYAAANKEIGASEQKAKLTSGTFTTNGTFTREDGWNSVIVDVPQSQDCEDTYQQAYEDGKAAAEGEISSVFIRITSGEDGRAVLALRERDLKCNDSAYNVDFSYGLVRNATTLDFAFSGSAGVKYATPTSLSFLVYTTDVNQWGANWQVEQVRFNGFMAKNVTSYDGGFKAYISGYGVAEEDSLNSRITIYLD